MEAMTNQQQGILKIAKSRGLLWLKKNHKEHYKRLKNLL